jgi:uncharacterized protein (DUF486 family)
MMKSILSTIGLLILSNTFMTMAWYGHLRFFGKNANWNPSLFVIILISWGIAFFEYCFQVPANRIGFDQEGGPFTLVQLKVIQEVVTLVVFTVFSLVFFKNLSFKWNHLAAFGLLIGAVYLIFKK